MDTNYGWDIKEENSKNYNAFCLEASKDEELFGSFKINPSYTKILEGGPREVADYYFQKILDHPLTSIFNNNVDKFMVNESIGRPKQYKFEFGDCSSASLKNSYNLLDIMNFIGSENEVKTIVEIGGGYGGVACILHELTDKFDKYILIDTPEACALADVYLKEIGKSGKIVTLPCTEVEDYDFGSIDLCIAVNSLSECNLETQKMYFKNVICNASFSYIVRNIDTQENYNAHQECISLLDDTFLVDDSERVEERWSQNRVVYIKKDEA